MKLHPDIKEICLLVGATIALLGFSTLQALSTDKDQPVQIEADAAELDDNTGITVYTGSVKVTQGSLVLTGNKLTITYTEDNSLDVATMEGTPATFHQKTDGNQGDIDGEGVKIEYMAQEDKLIATEDAKLTQKSKLFRAYRIEYDTKLGKMVARKAVQGEATPSGKSARSDTGRIKVVLPPKKKAEN